VITRRSVEVPALLLEDAVAVGKATGGTIEPQRLPLGMSQASSDRKRSATSSP
jgi:hypothetical protein